MNRKHDITRAIVWLWRVATICRKELVQFRRNWVLAVFLIYTFTFATYNSAKNLSTDLKKAGLVVIDHDRSRASRELIYRFHEPQFHFIEQLANERDGVLRLDSGEAALVLDIPKYFQQDLQEGRHVPLQVQLDGADANRAYLAANYAGHIVGRYSNEIAWRRAGVDPKRIETLPVVENDERVWFSPNHDETLFNAIKDLAQHILLFSLLLPAAALAREKERGTVEQLLVSPLSPLQIMLGKILPMTAIILLVSVISLFVVIEGALGLQVRGNLALFVVVTALFSSSSAGLGILIASLTRNIGQVGLVSITLMPIMLMLSGSDTPAEMMPKALLPIMYLSPLHHYLNAAFGILIKGAPLAMLWDSVIYMVLLGGCIFGFSLLRFRQSFR